MGRAGGPLLALAALCWAPREASGTGGAPAPAAAPGLVSQEDLDFADKIKALDEQACGNPLLGGSAWLVENTLLVETSTDTLYAETGGKSILKDHLSSGEEFQAGDYISDIMASSAFVLPMYLAFGMCFCFCATCCQYKFQCCRCRAHKRVFGKRVKLAIWGVLLFLCVVIGYEGLYKAWKGILQIEVGLEAFLCGATELVSVTLNGHAEEPTFPGTISTLRDMEGMTKFLDEGSEFLKGLDTVIDDIGHMYQDAVPARAALGLLDSLHGGLFAPGECTLCEEMDVLLAEAKKGLETNSGYVLAMQAKKDLKPSDKDKAKILDGISSATAPLLNLQQQMSEVGEGLSSNVAAMVETWLPAFTVFMFIMTSVSVGSALILVFCGCTAAVHFTFYETVQPKAEAKVETEAKKDEETAALVEADANAFNAINNNSEQKDQEATAEEFNPYNPKVQFWAKRTWCWGFCYSIVTLFIGAFTSLAVVPVTESCALMTELKRDSSAVDSFGSAVEDKEQTKRLVEGCIIADNAEPGLLMDIMGTPGVNASYVPLRKTLADDVSKTMEGLFSELIESSQAPYVDPQHEDPMLDLFEVFYRDEATLKSQLPNSQFTCPLFEDAFGQDCDTKDYTAEPLCLLNYLSDDYEDMVMRKRDRSCTRDEYVAYLQAFVAGTAGGGRLQMPLVKFNMAVAFNKDSIQSNFQKVWDEHIGSTVAELSDKTDCRYIGIYYKQLVTGLCAQAVVGINNVVSASVWSGYFAVALTIAMYLLWRMAQDNYDHHAELAPAEIQAALEEEERLRAEADRSGWVLTSGLKEQDKAIDQSLIPESVRKRQEEEAAKGFDSD